MHNTPRIPFASFQIDDDAQSTPGACRDIPQIALSGTSHFLVRCRSGQYYIRGYDSDHSEVWCDSVPIELAENAPNVFRLKGTNGLLVDKSTPLVRGGSYILVYRSPAELVVPAEVDPSLISPTHACDPSRSWQGILITIPFKTGYQFNNWCRDRLEREVVDMPPQVEIVFPPTIEHDDGTVQVVDARYLIGGLGRNWKHPIVEMHDLSTSEYGEELIKYDTEYFSLQSLSTGRHDLYVRDTLSHAFAKLAIEVSATEQPLIKGVVLRTKARSNDESSFELMSDDATIAWGQLLTGDSFFLALEIPERYNVKLRWTELRSERPKEMLLTPDSANDILHNFLAEDCLMAELDAGTLGLVQWKSVHRSPATIHLALPPLLVRRMNLLLWACMSESSQRVPLERCAFDPALSDRLHVPTLQAFIDLKEVPINMLPLARAVRKELLRFSDRRLGSGF